MFNPYNLESLSELPIKENKPMLTTDQIDKLELCRDWIEDVAASDEYLKFPNTGRLQYAIRHIEAVLSENQPCEYTPKLVIPVRASIKDRLRSAVLDASIFTLRVSLVGIVATLLSTVFCYGLDRVQLSRGENYRPTWLNQAKVFEGLAICSFAVSIGSVVVGICTSGGDEDA